MSNMFTPPAPPGGESIEWSELENSLLIFRPYAHEQNIQTVHGASDAIRCDLLVVDGHQAGTVHRNTLVFPTVLRNQLLPSVGNGQMVLGRLGKGQAQPGKNAPWLLYDPTPQDITAAQTLLNQQRQGAPQPQAPQPQQAAPPQPPQPQQVAPPQPPQPQQAAPPQPPQPQAPPPPGDSDVPF